VSKVLKNAVLSENSGITSLAIDQSAEKMVLGTINGTVLMYSVGDTTSKEIYHHDDRVISVDFIPEKNWLVSTSADRSIMLWDLNTSELIEKIRHPDIPLALEVLDSQNMITSNSKGDMFLWMLNDINTISNPGILYNAGNQPIHSLAYNAAHHLLVAGTEGNTLLFSYAVGETRMMVPVSFTMKHKGKVSKLEFSHDNRWLASAGWDGQIMLWDLKDMKIEEFERIVPVITENDQKIFSLCFDPNDDYLIFGDNVKLHIKAININLAYGQLKHFVGDKTLNDQEWNYYIKGDLQRPSEDYTATTHGQ
jgi:WD40 repeat protein